MKKNKIIPTATFAVCCMLCFAFAISAADWPQQRGPNRDGKSPETGLLKEWPAEGLKPLWVTEGLGDGYSGVAVVQESIYTTGMTSNEVPQGVLYALDLSGTIRWKKPYGPAWNEMYPGTRATPTVDGDRIYLLSGTGRLLCFNRGDGEIIWSVDVVDKFGAVEQPCGFAEAVLVEDDKVICTPGGPDAGIVAIDKTKGETLWTTKGFSQQSAYCTPIVIERGGTRWLITMTAKSVVAVDLKSGEVAWKSPVDPEEKFQNHSVSPVYLDGMIYVTSGHGEGGQMIQISTDGREVVQKWTDETLSCNHGGLVLEDGYVYGANKNKKWVCLDLKTGEVMYEADGVGSGSVSFADGMLYCYGENGTLGLVKATPQGYELSGRSQVTQGEGNHWTHPVIAGGRLYIRHGSALIAYEIDGG
jgi:outer membrane protein assembly factor BamB